MNKNDIEKIVRNMLINNVDEEQPKNKVIAKNLKVLELDKFDTGNPTDKVFLKDAISSAESKNLGCGVMEMKTTTFEWFLDYDEIDYVIEGELQVLIGDDVVKAKAGEIIFIPANTKIKFCVPYYAKFMYVTYPVDWDK